jgi:predicted ester cyclase
MREGLNGLRFTVLLVLMVLLGTVDFERIALAQDVTIEHKAVIQRLIDEAVNGGNVVFIDETFAADYVSHNPAGNQSADDVKDRISALRAASPDLQATIEVMLGEGEWVATREQYRGTFVTPLVLDVGTWQPNQQAVEWHENNFYRFNADSMIAEAFIGRDELGFRRQIGGLPLLDVLAQLTTDDADGDETTPLVMGETVVPGAEESHREGIRQVIELALNQGNVDMMDAYMDDAYVGTDPFGAVSREQFKAVVLGLRSAVPDLHVEIAGVIADGDWGAARLIYGGTFTNPIAANVMTVEPTGREFKFALNLIVHFNEQGLADADWKEFNALGWLQQLGVMPAPVG